MSDSEIEMDNTDCEPMDLEDDMQTEIVHTELDTQEIEIESDLAIEEEEILTDIIDSRTPVPPLRPLSIAPKPVKVPLTYKSSSGQQVFVVQGSGGSQSLKLVASVPQGLSLGKTIALRTVPKTVPATNLSVLQPKQVIMKKVIQPAKAIFSNEPKTILVKESSEQQATTTHNNFILSSPAKTLTFAQAQQLGIISGTKLITQIGSKQTLVVPKNNQAKSIKLLPQAKQPPKILPAPEPPSSKAGRFILKQTNNPNSSLMAPGQFIQVSGSQQFIAGQLHQINIPGKGVQYIKIVTSAATSGTTTAGVTSTSTINSKKVVLTSTTESKVPLLTPVNNVTTSKLNNIELTENSSNSNVKPIKTNAPIRTAIVPTTGQVLLLPAPKVAIPQIKTVSTPKIVSESTLADMSLDSNGMRPRKPCNCTKSQCLKLYCDCFANGEFCYLCNCTNCSNNLENEELRQRAIKSCLDRNPSAFRPKIGKARDTGEAAIRKHTKGCNCKRSGCLKNYCECYEAKIACSSNCKCVGCRNIEDMIDKKTSIVHNSRTSLTNSPPILTKMNNITPSVIRQRRLSNRYAFNFITDEVIEATSQCLIAISEEADDAQDEEVLKHQIIKEFGRCLMDIIECSSNRVITI